jgi:hypothetical protein
MARLCLVNADTVHVEFQVSGYPTYQELAQGSKPSRLDLSLFLTSPLWLFQVCLLWQLLFL